MSLARNRTVVTDNWIKHQTYTINRIPDYGCSPASRFCLHGASISCNFHTYNL